MICSLNHPSAAQAETVNTRTHLISRKGWAGAGVGGLGDCTLSVHPRKTAEGGEQKAQVSTLGGH